MAFNPGYSKPGYSVSVNGVRREEAPRNPVIPPGGNGGSVLVKKTSADYDYFWMDISDLLKAQRNEDGEFILNEDGAIILND